MCVLLNAICDDNDRSKVKAAAMNPVEESEYQTPPTCDLLSLLLRNRRPTGAVNEVWPNLYIGDA